MVIIEPIGCDPVKILTIARLGESIWHECYAGIVPTAQIDYMLQRFQSTEAVTAQINDEGYRYFLISEGDEAAGYCGIRIDGQQMYLSKMYLLDRFRGRGLFSAMLAYLCEIGRNERVRLVWLTVNRNNLRAIGAYRHLGFRDLRTERTDIGEGFFMDDYVLGLDI